MPNKRKSKEESLPASLMKWATDEMKFHASAQNSESNFKPPSEEDFQFLCSGPLVDVWKYVTKHVKSIENAKLIKGNVELRRRLGALSAQVGGAQTAADEEEMERRQVLSQQKSRLARELEQLRAEVSQLKRELGHATEELATTELTYQRGSQRVRDLHHRASLLNVVEACAEETGAKYEEYTRRLDKCVEAVKNKRHPSQENFISGSSAEEDEELETESGHMVRQTCEDISKFIKHSLDTESGDDGGELGRKKSDVIDKVERAAAINSTQSLLQALAANAERGANDLRQKTSALDISKDAQEISFSYDAREGLQDLSSPPSATDTVRKLLLKSSEEHVLRWFKQQEHLNEEWKLSSRQTDTVNEINKLLHRVIGEHPSHIAAAKSYVESRIRLAEERTVAPCLRKEAVQLVDRISKAQKKKEELQIKYAQIQDFQKLVGKKQTTISKLAKLNAAVPERLKSRRQEVETYLASRSLMDHLAEVKAMPTRLKGVLTSELDAFLGVLLPCLLTLPVDSHTRLCALDLSISPDVHALAFEKLQTYADVCKALEFPMHKSAECLPLHVLNIHVSQRQLRAAQKLRESAAAAALRATGKTDDLTPFIGLREMAEKQDKAQKEKLLPQLREGITQANKEAALVDLLRKMVATW
ncbi:HAUS augmin-like complex subunit 5 [Elysia marginata]|uniref:HAUS augmin-like complex subunit 5 n=1 Tax=Elysia marginata TaxID=1093978 RepID=A0AAV4GT93_9GAST|nr:HAUS augmin-like complex subunit 5 [Elysia marginata]